MRKDTKTLIPKSRFTDLFPEVSGNIIIDHGEAEKRRPTCGQRSRNYYVEATTLTALLLNAIAVGRKTLSAHCAHVTNPVISCIPIRYSSPKVSSVAA